MSAASKACQQLVKDTWRMASASIASFLSLACAAKTSCASSSCRRRLRPTPPSSSCTITGLASGKSSLRPHTLVAQGLIHW